MISTAVIEHTVPHGVDENFGLLTLEVRVPLFVWTHILTHKRFARNASSNRAMPNDRNLELGYFTPTAFMGQGVGMKSGQMLSAEKQIIAEAVWKHVWDTASIASQILSMIGVSKEQSSRVLPQFKMMLGVVTGTRSAWKAFLSLRNNTEADVATQEFAAQVVAALQSPYKASSLHLPYSLREPADLVERMMLCAARIARTSYGLPKQKEDDLRLAKRLLEHKHMSPFEHTAQWVPMSRTCATHTQLDADEYKKMYADSPVFGWANHRSILEEENPL